VLGSDEGIVEREVGVGERATLVAGDVGVSDHQFVQHVITEIQKINNNNKKN
jgi:hypothetical protein